MKRFKNIIYVAESAAGRVEVEAKIIEGKPSPVRRVMACVDFNGLDPPDQDTAEPLNRMILEMAGLLAFAEPSEYRVVHAWEATGEPLMRSGRTGIPGFIIGNTAESVLNQIHCSVLAVKPPEFVAPVTLEE